MMCFLASQRKVINGPNFFFNSQHRQSIAHSEQNCSPTSGHSNILGEAQNIFPMNGIVTKKLLDPKFCEKRINLDRKYKFDLEFDEYIE